MECPAIKGAIELLEEFEGLHLEAYLCPSGVWTIGLGTTFYPDGTPVQAGHRCTKQQAYQWAAQELGRINQQLNSLVRVELSRLQRTALLSLVYNVGVGAFSRSRLLEKLNRGDFYGAAGEFDDWVHGAAGEVLPGLVKRRAREKILFLADVTPPKSEFVFSNFFKYYDERNPKHRNAVEELAKHIPPEQLSDSANWVRIYRSPWPEIKPGGGESGNHVAAQESVRRVTSPGIDWQNPNARVSEFFSVREVTNGDPRRIPTDPQIKANILRLAGELDKLRRDWGGPIGVTSWYRPPAINAAVGGVPNSTHIDGIAADIYPIDRDGHEFEEWLDLRWEGGLGYGQRSGLGFTHVDLRPGRLRWRY